ncbi:MAG: DUF5615 family PIN-like protein [Ignavibacteriae bacterium]|nr:DUF5615 family PIN-like protein [Ignavibacteriota bacterium]
MKWLVDAQLPPSLCDWFRSRNELAVHVSELLGGISMPDELIWSIAKRDEFVVISKDRDFFDRSIVYGSPPQIVYLDFGNCSNENLFLILHQHWGELQYALKKGRSLVVISKKQLLTF